MSCCVLAKHKLQNIHDPDRNQLVQNNQNQRCLFVWISIRWLMTHGTYSLEYTLDNPSNETKTINEINTIWLFIINQEQIFPLVTLIFMFLVLIMRILTICYLVFYLYLFYVLEKYNELVFFSFLSITVSIINVVQASSKDLAYYLHFVNLLA